MDSFTRRAADAPRGERHRIPSATKGARLCLDLGTICGWAIRLGGDTKSGSIDFTPAQFDPFGRRYSRFRDWLCELLDSNPISEVYFEEVKRHTGTDAAHLYGGLHAHLTAACYSRNMPCHGVPVGTIKKSATGHGGAKKQEVMAALTRLGYKPKDSNEADALALLEYICGDER